MNSPTNLYFALTINFTILVQKVISTIINPTNLYFALALILIQNKPCSILVALNSTLYIEQYYTSN